jgi:hypothetical protein
MKNDKHISECKNTWRLKNMYMTKNEIMWHGNKTHVAQKACNDKIWQSYVLGPKTFFRRMWEYVSRRRYVLRL